MHKNSSGYNQIFVWLCHNESYKLLAQFTIQIVFDSNSERVGKDEWRLSPFFPN